jgi:hypothetical protein
MNHSPHDRRELEFALTPKKLPHMGDKRLVQD